jgi:2-oxoglutarate ferredoxin oxidoreductase subunit alpha
LETDQLDDAEVVVVSYGIAARTAVWPIQMAREEGIRVGLLRLVTVWPFPDEIIRDLAGQVSAIVVPEINMGQIVREVERCAAGQAQVISVPHPGGGIHDPQKVLNTIRMAAGREVEV